MIIYGRVVLQAERVVYASIIEDTTTEHGQEVLQGHNLPGKSSVKYWRRLVQQVSLC
jgi:hypothetical protein